jgi:hypothetical protein
MLGFWVLEFWNSGILKRWGGSFRGAVFAPLNWKNFLKDEDLSGFQKPDRSQKRMT